MNLSANFTLPELCKTQVRLPNEPPTDVIRSLTQLALYVLQPIRDKHGPVVINSGYRSPQVNQAVGSKPNSQHVFGMAADIECPALSNYDLACWIRENLDTDQIILEMYTHGEPRSGWVHVSYNHLNNRNKTLTFDGKSYREGLIA